MTAASEFGIRAARAADVATIEAIVERAYRGYVECLGFRPGPMGADYADLVGRELVSVLEDHARAGGRAEIRLYTHAKMSENRAIYAHLGYRETDRRDAEGFDRVFLIKELHL